LQDFTFGPRLTPDGVLFRFWAPRHDSVDLVIDDQAHGMEQKGDGWFERLVPDARPGTLYSFRLPDGLTVPDPASRHQPKDVHGPSEVIDPAYRWTSNGWKGHAEEDLVLYETHVGTFTREGTFRAAIEKLDHLRSVGVTAIQLMPIADFPGRFGWGYDGTLPYAPESSYGRPEDLKALVDAAHGKGISVFLDVVYNHLGPDGNYLPTYAPFFTDKHKTPWGDGINYDGEGSKPIRDFMVENALYWLTEFRIDGLRLDAVHAIIDDSPEHLLHEIARRARAAVTDRPLHLVVENENNDSDLLKRDRNGAPTLYTAQWNDDIHHVLHIAATEETFGYYGDYTAEADNLGKALAEGFVFQGEHMAYRGEARGKPSRELPPTAFISFIQNHDQIGNRALGDRMSAAQPEAPLKAITAIYLLSPQTPMLFMGEEWGAKEPFPYFCDFNDELNRLVREGRKKELSRLPGFDEDQALDPTSPETFQSAKLDWSGTERPEGRAMLDFYRELLRLRREKVAPLVRSIRGENAVHRRDGNALFVRWEALDGNALTLRANLGAEPYEGDLPALEGDVFFSLGDASDQRRLEPWSVAFSIGKKTTQ
jgi:1,4-alpha-glucan branching enzyme/maltooligosyltrehalose trehalohydrolase